MKTNRRYQKLVALLLVAQLVSPLSSPFSMNHALAADASFAQVLKTFRVQLDRSSENQAQVLKNFAETLVDQGIGVAEVDAYVKAQLTAKEYKEFKSYLKVSMKGIDPDKLSPEEFAQIISRALSETQSKGLTWSSCTARNVGFLIAAAAVIVGIVAIAKQKLDFVTNQKLYDAYVSKRNTINAGYADKDSLLKDPSGYFNRKINSAQNAIDRKLDEIDNTLDKIDDAYDEIKSINKALDYDDLYGGLTVKEREDLIYRLGVLSDNVDYYSKLITSLKSDVRQLDTDIDNYEMQKVRYSDPNVVASERAALEKWYADAIQLADHDYQVSLENLPNTNDNISMKNESIVKTRKTLGIIAGVGGVASLALILSNTGECR